jgi:steroid delta-isomerase-like uncharacterized protein
MIDAWLELWNTQTPTIADELFAPEFKSHIPQFPQVSDVESYKEEVRRTRTEIADFRVKLDDMIESGDKVAGRFTATGTARGELMGMPVNKTKYTNTWIVIFRLTGGTIAEEWWQFDALGVLQQLGVMSPMAEGPPAMQRTRPEDFMWSSPSQVTGDPGDPQSNKALIVREFDAWNNGTADSLLAVLDEIYADDFLYHDPGRPHVTDRAGYKQWLVDEVLIPFSEVTLSVDDILAAGDRVVVRWDFNGTLSAVNKPVTQTGSTIYRIAGGSVVEGWCASDMLGAVQQMKSALES